MSESNQWPKNFTTEKYGSFVAVHQDYSDWNRAWKCTYQRISDGRYFTFSAQSHISTSPSDQDFLIRKDFDKIFLPNDKTGGES